MKNQNAILCILLGICLGLLIGRKTSGQTEIKEIVKTDTLTIVETDTIRVLQPQPCKIVVRDTIEIIKKVTSDSIYLHQTQIYKDSTYTAQISGINPKLDYIDVYPRMEYKYITQTERVYQEPKKWGVGVQVGYGVGRNGLQPYVGVGVSYNLIRF